MKKFLGLALSLALVMALGTVSFAAQDAPKPAKPAKSGAKATAGEKAEKKATKSGKHQLTGTVSSVTATEITIKPAKGEAQTFTHDATTQKADTPKEGDKVTVMYKEDGGKKMATSIKAAKASGSKAAGKKANGKPKAPKM